MTICPSGQGSAAEEVWCFQCGAGYAATVAECPECGVVTVDQPPTDESEVGDPDGEKLEYDFHSYSAEARSMLESLLLGADIHHAWHGAVLIVGGRVEQQVDELVKSMEKATRPALDPNVEVVGYELAELSDDEVTRLTEALEDAEIPYGFDSDGDLEVAVSDEDRVDSLFDALASGAAQETFGPGLEGVEPHEVISKLFLASDRLARNPRDRRGLKDLNRFGEDIHQLSLPFGFDGKVWRALLQKVGALQDVVAEHHTAEEVASTAAETRAALHQFV